MTNKEAKQLLADLGNPSGVVTILGSGAAMHAVGTLADGLPDDLKEAIEYVERVHDEQSTFKVRKL